MGEELANCIRGENVRVRNFVRRMNMGFDTLLGHKQAVWVARWLDIATGRLLDFSNCQTRTNLDIQVVSKVIFHFVKINATCMEGKNTSLKCRNFIRSIFFSIQEFHKKHFFFGLGNA